MDAPSNKKPEVIIPKAEPRRYIRTFEGDAAILQKGGTPDLVPYGRENAGPANAAPAPQADLDLGGTESPYAPAVQIPVPERAAMVPHALHTLPTIDVAAPQPVQPPPAPEPPAPPVLVSPTTLETYAGDFTDRVSDEKASAATILAAEQDAGPDPEAPRTIVQHHHTWVYLSVGAALFLLGGAGSYVAYLRYQTNTQPVAATPFVSAPIFVDDREVVAGTSTPLLSAVTASVKKPLAAGTVRLLYETATTTADLSIFNALMLPAPDILLRNVVPQGSMAGIVNMAGTQTPFFILSVSSYGDTFAGMLSWEKSMPRDLAAFFPKNDTIAVASSTVATTTLALNTAPLFMDEVIANHDARVYQDAGGPIIVYGYWNQQTLVITRDPAAFTEILSRLGTSKATQQ